MLQNTLTREPFSFASGPRLSRRPERISPALVRRMAARLALETRQIEREAQEAMHEVWDEPAHSQTLSFFTAQAV
jgi:hypothetical protein